MPRRTFFTVHVMTPATAPVLGRSVSIDQAARELGVSRRTIYNRIREGHLQTVRTSGGSQRVTRESMVQYFTRKTAGGSR